MLYACGQFEASHFGTVAGGQRNSIENCKIVSTYNNARKRGKKERPVSVRRSQKYSPEQPEFNYRKVSLDLIRNKQAGSMNFSSSAPQWRQTMKTICRPFVAVNS